MPRGAVRRRRFVAAMSCAGILAALALGVLFWWSAGGRQSGLLGQGQAAYDRKDWPAAQASAREQLKFNRADTGALRLLGRALFRQGRDEDATAIFGRLNPDTIAAEDYLLIGQSLIRAQNVDSAIEAWRKALRLEPAHLEATLALEQALFRLDRLADAEKVAGRLLAQPGREGLAELLRGQVCVQLSDPAGAAEALHLALDHSEQWQFMADPDLFRKQLAMALLRTGQPARARTGLRQLTGGARDPEICWLLSRCDLQESIPTEPAILALARAYRESHPMAPEPAPFVGEAQCARCHPGICRDQYGSRHARTYSGKEQLPPLPFPPGPIPDPGNARVSHGFERGDGLEMRTEVGGQVYRTIVDYAFGSGDRGLTLVGHNQEGQSLECRLSYYSGGMGWDLTTGQSARPDQPTSLYQGKPLAIDDLRHCMNCHNTDPHAVLTGTGPAASDRAIGCERCHGPGGHHLKVALSGDIASNHDADLAIARPSLASGPDIVALCAECHSPRKTGLNLERGSPGAVRFQGTTLTWSRCYTESNQKLDCVTCHNPHRNVETSMRWYESRCLQCHSPGTAANPDGNPASGSDTGRQTTCPLRPASNCIACHMPKVETTTAHSRFTDHFIRVHD
jgi:tetratricopeptide (TPR) repeat protein